MRAALDEALHMCI